MIVLQLILSATLKLFLFQEVEKILTD